MIDLDLKPLAWMVDAACADHDLGAFFPNTTSEESPEARAICSSCPVRTDCLEYALDRGEQWGIWGGLTTPERREIRRDRARALTSTTPTTEEETPTMAEDIYGEPIGDERVTYAQPPILTPPAHAGLSPVALAAARLLDRTEGHDNPSIRSARKIAAQALLHLDELFTLHRHIEGVTERALDTVHEEIPQAFEKAAERPPARRGDRTTTERKRSPSAAVQLMERHGITAADVRTWAHAQGLEVNKLGNPKLTLVMKYIEALGGPR